MIRGKDKRRPGPESRADASLERVLELSVGQVVPDPEQPRKDTAYDDGVRHLRELSRSVEAYGILNPLLVRRDGSMPDGLPRYVVIAGHRRLLAANLLGLQTVPAILREEQGLEAALISLAENFHRQSISPMDEAAGFEFIMRTYNINASVLARRLGVGAQRVRDRVRVAQDPILSGALVAGRLQYTVARTILQTPDTAVREELRRRVAAGIPVGPADLAAAAAGAPLPDPPPQRARATTTRWSPTAPMPPLGTTIPPSRPPGARARPPVPCSRTASIPGPRPPSPRTPGIPGGRVPRRMARIPSLSSLPRTISSLRKRMPRPGDPLSTMAIRPLPAQTASRGPILWPLGISSGRPLRRRPGRIPPRCCGPWGATPCPPSSRSCSRPRMRASPCRNCWRRRARSPIRPPPSSPTRPPGPAIRIPPPAWAMLPL